jgi:hypothetical protein
MAAVMIVISVLQFRPATGAPGDIFTIAAPTIGSDPPKAADVKDGDVSVATTTGALQYAYPIQVPPGRNGMAPDLALSYSSQAPTYGGVAAGWSLSVPIITEDQSQGRLRTRSTMVEELFLTEDPKKDDRFVSSLAGGRPLVPVTEPTGLTTGGLHELPGEARLDVHALRMSLTSLLAQPRMCTTHSTPPPRATAKVSWSASSLPWYLAWARARLGRSLTRRPLRALRAAKP